MTEKQAHALRMAVDYAQHAGAGFMVLEVNRVERVNEIVTGFQEHLGQGAIRVVDLALEKSGALSALENVRNVVLQATEVSVFCILNMHAVAGGNREEEIRLIRNLNMRREAFENLGKVLVFFFPSYFLALFNRYGLDFLDFAPARFSFCGEAAAGLSLEEVKDEEEFLKNRIAFLEQRLESDGLSRKERLEVLKDLRESRQQLEML